MLMKDFPDLIGRLCIKRQLERPKKKKKRNWGIDIAEFILVTKFTTITL